MAATDSSLTSPSKSLILIVIIYIAAACFTIFCELTFNRIKPVSYVLAYHSAAGGLNQYDFFVT